MHERLVPLDPLPTYKPLESLARIQKGELMEVLLDDTICLPPGERFTDVGFEAEYPEAPVFTNIFAELLTDNTVKAQRVAYRSFNAAYTIVGLLRGETRPVFLPGVYLEGIKDVAEDERVSEVVVAIAYDYLRLRPHLSDLVGACLSEVSESGEYLQPAEVIAATTLMINDQSERRSVLGNMAAKFSPN